MSSGDEYSATVIRKTVWGQISPASDGGWVTLWRFQMDTTRITSVPTEVVRDNEQGFSAELHMTAPGEASLQVRTLQEAMTPEYYPLTFKSFRIVNDELGIIKTIEGLPRDWYAPFRSRAKLNF
jgi:hypothetical protein